MSDRADRDMLLEEALATLTPPPAKARFHERLWERVDAVEQMDAVETPMLLESLEAPAPGDRFHERLWDRIDASEQVEAVEARPVEHRGAGGRPRWVLRRSRLAVALAAAAVAVWLVVSLIGLPHGGEQGILSGPPPAVAQVIENVRLRLDSVRSLSAIFTYQRTGAPVYRARMVATSDGRTKMASIAGADGSWRVPAADATLADTPGLHVEVTSMPDGTRTEAWDSGKALAVARTTGLSPGPPDARGTGFFPVEYAGQMSALAIAGSKVISSNYGSRPVLVVSAPAGPASARQSTAPGTAPRFDRVSMTIDRETWLPVRVVRTYRGDVVEAWVFRDVELDPPLTTADFAVQLPSSAQVMTGTDQGFRRVSLQEAGAAVKGRLYVPEALPEGFELSLAAVKTPEPSSQSLAPPNESSVASLVYRRGFRSVVVTTRSVDGAAIDPADDPFAGSSTFERAGTGHLVLRSGWLTGARAFVSTRPLELPHLWLLKDGLMVTVAGDITRKELVQIAGSLETYGVWHTRQVFTAYAAATRAYDLSALSDLYSDGITIADRSYRRSELRDALIANSEWTDYFVSGKATAPFIGDGTGVWEAWPAAYSSLGGRYSPEAIAEVVTTRGEKVVREDFYLVSGPSRPANEAIPRPARVTAPLGPTDTAAAARRIALACAAALRAKDAARLARMSAGRVAFLDIDYGDAGGRATLLRRYERMFGFPADLVFARSLIASGPGWAVLRWTASSKSIGYQTAPGLTVLEIRDGKVVRHTLYCAKDRMPFR